MTGLAKLFLAGAVSLSLAAPVLAGDAPAVPQDAAAAAREKLMNETICRNVDDDDTGSHVRHRTCKKRSEWLAIDKQHNSQTFDPTSGQVVIKE